MSELQTKSYEEGYNQLIEKALYQSVPSMDKLREQKIHYKDIPIDITNEKSNEPVVDIADYGIAGQGYASRPNATMGEPDPRTSPTVYLRQSVAETLARINASLHDPAITEFFGGEVELYIEEGLRTFEQQSKLYNEIWPSKLYEQNPTMTKEEMEQRRKDLIAMPSADATKPSPHATGGAVDVILRYKQDTLGYVEGSDVPVGHFDGETGKRVDPDYFEYTEPKTNEDKHAQRNRRAYYAIMTGAAFGVDTEFANNPTEWWHWGRGDQLSAMVRGERAAYYSLAESK